MFSFYIGREKNLSHDLPIFFPKFCQLTTCRIPFNAHLEFSVFSPHVSIALTTSLPKCT